MDLATLRKKRGLSQEQLARELGLKGKASVCEIERTGRAAPERALKIEAWSGGKIQAHTLNPLVAQLRANG